MVEPYPSKLMTRVRFPSSAPNSLNSTASVAFVGLQFVDILASALFDRQQLG